MQFTVTLAELNGRLIDAWNDAFAGEGAVQVVHDSMLRQQADAWVTPTNARATMDGGFDAVVRRYLGDGIQQRVKREVRVRFGGSVPVGCAACAPTDGLVAPPGGPLPKFLISSPTMGGSAECVRGTLNVALAFGAALQAAAQQNRQVPGSIRSLALPGLGSSTGRVPAEDVAVQMRLAYEVLRRQEFFDFAAMREAILERLGGRSFIRFSPGAATAKIQVQTPRGRRKRLFGWF